MVTNQPADDTRERLLIAASQLFAKQGYDGTSTRAIAEALGIRQPSIFHHFASKTDILRELIQRDLGPARGYIDHWAQARGPVAPRLAAYIITDIESVLDSPFDNRGLYRADVLFREEFKPERQLLEEALSSLGEFVQEGIDSGEFFPIDVSFVQEAIFVLSQDSIRAAAMDGDTLRTTRPRMAARFVLRSLLADPSSIDTVIEATEQLLESDGAAQLR